jgi:hypothetical protein
LWQRSTERQQRDNADQPKAPLRPGRMLLARTREDWRDALFFPFGGFDQLVASRQVRPCSAGREPAKLCYAFDPDKGVVLSSFYPLFCSDVTILLFFSFFFFNYLDLFLKICSALSFSQPRRFAFFSARKPDAPGKPEHSYIFPERRYRQVIPFLRIHVPSNDASRYWQNFDVTFFFLPYYALKTSTRRYFFR